MTIVGICFLCWSRSAENMLLEKHLGVSCYKFQYIIWGLSRRFGPVPWSGNIGGIGGVRASVQRGNTAYHGLKDAYSAVSLFWVSFQTK